MIAKGVFALCSATAQSVQELRDRLEALLDSDEILHLLASADGHCVIGSVAGRGQERWLTTTENDVRTALGIFDGFTFSDSDIRARPSLLGQEGLVHRSHLNGMFTAASWRDGQLTVATDPFASTPMYFAADGHFLVAASSVEIVLRFLPHAPRIDRGSLSELLATQTFFGRDTLIEGVKKLPGATLLRWRAGRGAREERYWTAQFHADPASVAVPHAADALMEAVRRSIRVAPEPHWTALTGGLDARTTWSILHHDRTPCRAVTHAAAEGHDLRIARGIARKLDLSHRVIQLGDELLEGAEDDLAFFVRATNSTCSADQFHLPYLYRRHAEQNSALIDGVVTQIERSFGFRTAVVGATSRKRFSDGLWKLLRQDNLTSLLDETAASSIREEANARLDALLPDPSDFESPEFASESFFLTHMIQNHSADAAALQNHAVRFITPYYDLDYVDAAVRVSPSLRTGERIQREIMRRCAPRLLWYPRSRSDIWTLPVPWRHLQLLPVAWERMVLPHFPSPIRSILSPRKPSALHAEWFSGPLRPLFREVEHLQLPFKPEALDAFTHSLTKAYFVDVTAAGWLLTLSHKDGLLRRFS